MKEMINNFPAFPTYNGRFVQFADESDEAGFTITAVSSGTADVGDDEAGGVLILSGAATTDNSGASVQGNAAKITLSSTERIRFMTKVRLSDVVESDFFAGFYETDTDPVGGLANGIYFTKADGSARIKLVHEKATVATELDTAVDFVANTYVTLSFEAWVEGGVGIVNCYIDGKYIGQLTVADPLASTVIMRESVFFQTGDALGTKTCRVKGLGWLQGTGLP